MRTITVEELEIIVSAKIEQIKPQMQKVVQEVRKAVQDTEGFGAKILSKSDTEKIISQARKAGQKVKEAFDPNDTSGLTFAGNVITNNIKGISNEFRKLTSQKDALANAVDIHSFNEKIARARAEADKMKDVIKFGNVDLYKSQSASIQKMVDDYNRGVNEVKKVQENLKKSTTQGNKLASATQKVKNHLHGSKAGSSMLSAGLSKARNIASAVSGKLKVGLGQIIKMAGALFGLRSIYNVLRNAASSWLSSQNTQAQQLNTNIEYIKYAIGSALAPVIETIVNLIYQALKGVQSLIYALTGVNIFANASAKAYASMAKGAKDTQKAMQGVADIDEIHNIQQDNSSNGGSGGGVAPNSDLSGIDTFKWSNLIDKIKNGNWYEIGATIGAKINKSLEKIPWEKIKTTAGNIGKNIASFLNGGISSTDWKLVGGTLAEGINTAITFVGDFLKTFNFSETGKALADTITGFFDTVDWGKIGQMLSNGLSGALDFLLTFWANFDPQKVWDALWKVLSNIDWLGLLGKVAVYFLQAWWKVDPTVQIVKGVIKMFEGAINWIIRKVNQLKIPVPKWVQDWLGLPEEFSFNLQEIDFDVDHAMDKIVSSVTKGTETIENGIEDTSRTVQTNSNLIKTSMSRGMNGAYISTKDNMSKTKSEVNSTYSQMANSPIYSKVTEKVSWAMEQIRKNSNTSITQTKNATETTMTQLSNSSVFSKVKSTIQNALDQVKNSKTWGTNTASNYTNGMNSQQSNLLNVVKNIKSKVQSYLNQSGSSSSWGSSTVSRYKDGVSSQDNIVTKALNSVKEKIKNSLNNSNNSYIWGKDMIQGFMNGMQAMKARLESQTNLVAKMVSKYLHFSRPDVGPLRDYETWMPDMITGLSDSLLKASPKLDSAVSQVSSNIADNLRATTLGVDVNSNINRNITSNVMSSQLENAVYSAIQKAESLFRLTINSELKLNSKTLAKEILDDLNNEAKRRGYKPILEH